MSQLSDIAAQLKSAAQATGQGQTTLPRGLTLTYMIDKSHHQLSLTRHRCRPGDMEIKICQSCFGIPDDHHQETDRRGTWHIVRLRWQVIAEQIPMELMA